MRSGGTSPAHRSRRTPNEAIVLRASRARALQSATTARGRAVSRQRFLFELRRNMRDQTAQRQRLTFEQCMHIHTETVLAIEQQLGQRNRIEAEPAGVERRVVGNLAVWGARADDVPHEGLDGRHWRYCTQATRSRTLPR